MNKTKEIIECVPNFSEGRNVTKIEKILHPLRGKEEVKLLDYQRDENHNRLVVTVIGEPASLKKAMLASIGVAIDIIDMTKHEGQHPRMGAVDVVPIIPVKNILMDKAIVVSEELAKEMADTFDLPVFLYEASARFSQRENLANIRKGEFEKMPEKLKDPDWKPDFGPNTIHPTAGVTAVGARMPLVAFNVNLDTDNIDIANQIAKNVRHISGGLRYLKGIGVDLKDRGIVQVSMNMTNYTKTPLYRAVELIKVEARRFGVNVIGSEVIGLVPMGAIVDSAAYYMGIENFSIDQVLETRLME